MCANSQGSGETARIAYVISIIISWAGSFVDALMIAQIGYYSLYILQHVLIMDNYVKPF